MGKNKKQQKKTKLLIQEQLFNEYAVKYTCDKSSDIQENECPKKLKHARYVFDMLNTKEINETFLEELLELTIGEVKNLHDIKLNIESKVATYIALWGASFIAISQTGTLQHLVHILISSTLNSALRILSGSLICILITSSCFFIYFTLRTLKTQNYKVLNLRDKPKNYGASVTDKKIALIRFLELYSNIWDNNYGHTLKKSKLFQKTTISFILFIFFIIISILCNAFFSDVIS